MAVVSAFTGNSLVQIWNSWLLDLGKLDEVWWALLGKKGGITPSLQLFIYCEPDLRAAFPMKQLPLGMWLDQQPVQPCGLLLLRGHQLSVFLIQSTLTIYGEAEIVCFSIFFFLRRKSNYILAGVLLRLEAQKPQISQQSHRHWKGNRHTKAAVALCDFTWQWSQRDSERLDMEWTLNGHFLLVDLKCQKLQPSLSGY